MSINRFSILPSPDLKQESSNKTFEQWADLKTTDTMHHSLFYPTNNFPNYLLDHFDQDLK